jgi:hypothetical protein
MVLEIWQLDLTMLRLTQGAQVANLSWNASSIDIVRTDHKCVCGKYCGSAVSRRVAYFWGSAGVTYLDITY